MGYTTPQERVDEMYGYYAAGESLSQVGERYNLTRQSVFGLFRSRGLALRSKTFKPYIEFNGARYTVSKYGYYRKTDGSRSHMHRDVWEHYNGAIPDGWDVHHLNENKADNRIENLHCLPKPDHTLIHNPAHDITLKNCLYCGRLMERKRYECKGLEPPSAYAKRLCCNPQCGGEYRKGRSKVCRSKNQ